MAQRRAALLEKRMRREKESQMRKMQLEAELEQKKEGARYANLHLSFVKIKSQLSLCRYLKLSDFYLFATISCIEFLSFGFNFLCL